MFTCNRTGTYIISYTETYQATALALGSQMSCRTLIETTEIEGSQVTSNMAIDTDPIIVNRSCIAFIQSGETLSLELPEHGP